jgi:[NiFe] hydrogenase assembly HybE family chaperone
VAELAARFQQIDASEMRDLPLYHRALEVEAVGFERCENALVGALITPWFLSLIQLPLRKLVVDWSAVGHEIEHTLPGGRFTFRRGGDEIIGQYDAISLHSPVFRFESQELARGEASRHLTPLLAAPAAADVAPEQPRDPQRRAFLMGRASGR